MPTQEDVEEFNAAEKIEYLSAIGDQFKVGMMLTAQSSVREHATWLSLDMDALGNLTKEETDLRLRDITKVCASLEGILCACMCVCFFVCVFLFVSIYTGIDYSFIHV